MTPFKVLKPAAKSKVLTQAQMFESMVYFKFPDSKVYKTKARLSPSKRVITCLRPLSLPLSRLRRRVTMNFVLDSEVYFMLTDVTMDSKEVHFDLRPDILLLARRKNSRLKIPTAFEAALIVRRVAGQTTILRGALADLSSEGCKVALSTTTPELAQDEVLQGSLRVQNRKPIDIQGIIKYHKIQPRSYNKQVFGLQFTGLSELTINKIQGLVLDLQRELFLSTLEQI